jgi:hypothetical protein
MSSKIKYSKNFKSLMLRISDDYLSRIEQELDVIMERRLQFNLNTVDRNNKELANLVVKNQNLRARLVQVKADINYYLQECNTLKKMLFNYIDSKEPKDFECKTKTQLHSKYEYLLEKYYKFSTVYGKLSALFTRLDIHLNDQEKFGWDLKHLVDLYIKENK